MADFANNEQYNYTYDTDGNITSLIHYEMDSAFSHPISTLQNYTYTYGKSTWGDLLTNFNGQNITYDQIGNPLNYRDGITMTWKNGRELASFENDDVRVTYTYDPDGLRTRKNYEGLVTTDYVYESGLLKQMKYGSYIFTFSYDAYGSPIGFEFREEDSTSRTYYYYGINSRGDVLALYNSAGTQIASYSYDPYGKPISINKLVSGHTTAIEVQPLRYRSYVYDFETGLYYLQSRYYDPTTCRFVNADIYYETGQNINGYNMFAYCNNNSVRFSDYNGKRYCAGSNPDEETSYERERSCQWQNRVVKSKYNPEPVGSYGDGDIYIVEDPNDILAYFPGDVIVYDKRINNSKDESNFEIRNSYLITDINDQSDIIKVLLKYETENPSQWYRTFESMMIEWDAHNDAYYLFNLSPFPFTKKYFYSSKHVNFDNYAEGLSYYDHTFGKIKENFGF